MASYAIRSFVHGGQKVEVQIDSIRLHKTDSEYGRLNIPFFPTRDEAICSAICKHFMKWQKLDELEREFPKLDIE